MSKQVFANKHSHHGSHHSHRSGRGSQRSGRNGRNSNFIPIDVLFSQQSINDILGIVVGIIGGPVVNQKNGRDTMTITENKAAVAAATPTIMQTIATQVASQTATSMPMVVVA